MLTDLELVPVNLTRLLFPASFGYMGRQKLAFYLII